MAQKSPERAYEAKLKEIDAQIRRMPGAISLRFDRATLLERLNRDDAAKAAYLEVLQRDPKHFGAINNLAMLLFKTGKRQEAFLLYAEAVERHPDNAVAHANLAFMFLKANEPARARGHYESALQLDPKNVEAQRGLAAVLTQQGERDAAASVAGSEQSIVTLPYRGSGTPVTVLLLVTLGAGNVAAERLLDDRTFHVHKLTVELHAPHAPLPAHDLVFNAIGDADEAKEALAKAAQIVVSSAAPVVNRPEAVVATGRAANAERLRSVPGIVAPRIDAIPRDLLAGPVGPVTLEGRGFRFPLLLRSPGFHTGRHFTLVERPADLDAAVASLPGDNLLAIEYIDTRNAIGEYTKYRVMYAGGEMYPLHMAIAHQWKVHYFSSDMADRPDHRAREAAFLGGMEATFGSNVVTTLRRIGEMLGLEYAGIDFTFDRDGRIVVFEANATMIVTMPADDARWAYRRPPVERIYNAVRTMLVQRAVAANAS